MKLRIIMDLNTMEQVGIILATVQDWDINVDVKPIPTARTTARTQTKNSQWKATSDPNTVLEVTGTEPSTRPDLYKKALKKLNGPMMRKDIGWILAKIQKHETTKLTSTVVSKWINEGALQVVSG